MTAAEQQAIDAAKASAAAAKLDAEASHLDAQAKQQAAEITKQATIAQEKLNKVQADQAALEAQNTATATQVSLLEKAIANKGKAIDIEIALATAQGNTKKVTELTNQKAQQEIDLANAQAIAKMDEARVIEKLVAIKIAEAEADGVVTAAEQQAIDAAKASVAAAKLDAEASQLDAQAKQQAADIITTASQQQTDATQQQTESIKANSAANAASIIPIQLGTKVTGEQMQVAAQLSAMSKKALKDLQEGDAARILGLGTSQKEINMGNELIKQAKEYALVLDKINAVKSIADKLKTDSDKLAQGIGILEKSNANKAKAIDIEIALATAGGETAKVIELNNQKSQLDISLSEAQAHAKLAESQALQQLVTVKLEEAQADGVVTEAERQGIDAAQAAADAARMDAEASKLDAQAKQQAADIATQAAKKVTDSTNTTTSAINDQVTALDKLSVATAKNTAQSDLYAKANANQQAAIDIAIALATAQGNTAKVKELNNQKAQLEIDLANQQVKAKTNLIKITQDTVNAKIEEANADGIITAAEQKDIDAAKEAAAMAKLDAESAKLNAKSKQQSIDLSHNLANAYTKLGSATQSTTQHFRTFKAAIDNASHGSGLHEFNGWLGTVGNTSQNVLDPSLNYSITMLKSFKKATDAASRGSGLAEFNSWLDTTHNNSIGLAQGGLSQLQQQMQSVKGSTDNTSKALSDLNNKHPSAYVGSKSQREQSIKQATSVITQNNILADLNNKQPSSSGNVRTVELKLNGASLFGDEANINKFLGSLAQAGMVAS